MDTRAVDGNVYAMFIGSLSPGIDGRKDDVPSTMPGIASTPEEMF